MLRTTYDALKAMLKADPSIPGPERNQLLALLRNGQPKPPLAEISPNTARILRPAVVATRLNRSIRFVHRLAKDGVLRKITMPGRRRAIGFAEAEVAALISGESGLHLSLPEKDA